VAAWQRLARAVQRASDGVRPALSLPESWNLLAVRLSQRAPTAAAYALTSPLPESADQQQVWSMDALATAALAAGSHILGVCGGQARLLRPVVWIGSALGIALAVLYALSLPRVVGEQDALAFTLPIIAATGIAFLYGPEVDAGLELAMATPTSARVVLAGRFALLVGYDIALALVGTLALSLVRHDAFAAPASVWLGPMVLLSALSLALSVALGSAVALAGAAALWLSRMLHIENGISLQITASAFGQTTPQILVMSLALLALTLLWVPHDERLRVRDEG
jgi:hypothetical protein